MTKKKPAKEIVVVDDDEGEGEGEKLENANLPASLDQALATVSTLDSANSDVAATTSTSVQAQGPWTTCGQRQQHPPTVEGYPREVFK